MMPSLPAIAVMMGLCQQPPPAADPVEPPKKRRRGSAKKAFDAFLLGKRVARRAGLFIPKLSFERVVHQLIARHRTDLRIQQEALDILQETAEAMIVDRFQKCARVAELCRKDTVRREHWKHVQELEEEKGGAGAAPLSAPGCNKHTLLG
jgi:histone H3/H4